MAMTQWLCHLFVDLLINDLLIYLFTSLLIMVWSGPSMKFRSFLTLNFRLNVLITVSLFSLKSLLTPYHSGTVGNFTF